MLRSRIFRKVGVGNFGKVGVGAGYFTSDTATLSLSVLYAHEPVLGSSDFLPIYSPI